MGNVRKGSSPPQPPNVPSVPVGNTPKGKKLVQSLLPVQADSPGGQRALAWPSSSPLSHTGVWRAGRGAERCSTSRVGGPGCESGGSVLPLTLLQAAASFGRVPSSCFVLLLPRVRASPAQMAKTLLIQKQGIRELVRSVPFLTPPGGNGEGVVGATLDSLLGKDLLSLQQSTGGCELN